MIGRICCILCWCASICAVDVSLQLTDMAGRVLEEVTQGVPFYVTATVVGDTRDIREPRIDHLERCDHVERMPVTTSITLVNGVQHVKKKYIYRVRIDSVGRHVLGPAHCEDHHVITRSDARTFEVVAHDGLQEEALRDPCILVSVDKEKAYIGEQILLTVQLCYRKELTRFGLENISSQAFDVIQLYKPEQERVTIDGHQWLAVRYIFALYAKTTGEVVIPAITAECEREKDGGSGGFFAHMRSLWGAETEVVKACSQPLNINIVALPHVHPESVGVGRLESFRADIDMSQFTQSKGAVLTWSVTGNINLKQPNTHALTLPEHVRAYESKVYAETTDQAGIFTKKYEWIIQALKPGAFVIPAQKITYFDTREHTYKSLTTKPIECVVAPSLFQVKANQNQRTSVQDGVVKRVPQPLSFWLLVLLIMPPIAGMVVFRSLWLYRERIARYFVLRHLMSMMRESCDRNVRMKLYEAWIMLFQKVGGIDMSQMSLQAVGERFLRDDELNNWKRYVERVERYVCTQKKVASQGEWQELYRDTQYWFKRFRVMV
jgi:hypothetical protein